MNYKNSQQFWKNLPSHGTIWTAAVAAGVYGIIVVLLDLAIAHRFGTGQQAATFQASFFVLTFLTSVISGGAVFGAFVPIYVRLAKNSKSNDARTFSTHAGLRLGLWLMVAAMIVGATSPILFKIIASGFTGRHQDELVLVTRLMLPMLIGHGLASVLVAVLLSIGRVGLAQLSPALLPLCALAGYPLWNEHVGARILAIGFVAGALLQTVLLYAALRRWHAEPLWARRDAAISACVREFFHAYSITAVAHVLSSCIFLANQAIAGALSAKDWSVFSYATRLPMLAMAFLTTVAVNLLLPYFSVLVQEGGLRGAWHKVIYIGKWIMIVLIPIALLWAGSADWLVKILYVHGAFSLDDAAIVANVQRLFVLQIPLNMFGIVCWRMHNALERGRPLVFASLGALAIDLVVALPASQVMGVPGIAMAHTIAIAVWAAALFVGLWAQKGKALPGV